MFWSGHDHCDVSSASHQAACLTRSTAAALPSLMRYTRPLSVCSEIRLSPSFLRTTPARKPRTECCCQSVTVMIAAMVAPAGVRSIAMMRACLVSGPAAGFDDAGAGRLREAGLAVFRAVERVAAFDLDLGLVMGSSEVDATPSAAPPQPRPGKTPGRARPRSRPQPPRHHSNAPFKPESQSFLSKIVAHNGRYEAHICEMAKAPRSRLLRTMGVVGLGGRNAACDWFWDPLRKGLQCG